MSNKKIIIDRKFPGVYNRARFNETTNRVKDPRETVVCVGGSAEGARGCLKLSGKGIGSGRGSG